jgi:proteasome lid subunit RPN8/RPN11
MVCSAIEVFPKECMGCVLGKKNVVLSAFPYQNARRKLKEVTSMSSSIFTCLFKNGKIKKIADYHSHTYQHFERSEHCAPSAMDIAQLDVGGVEFIVQIRKRRKKSSYMRCSSGTIHIGWKRFRCSIVAFRRCDGFEECDILYDRVRLGLKK